MIFYAFFFVLIVINLQKLTDAQYCPDNSQCVPVTSCPLLNDILDDECVSSKGIAKLSCGGGYASGSDLICCPQQSEFNKTGWVKTVDGIRCGISQVLGNRYQGIGVFPWTARIGFKNVANGEVKYPCSGSIISNNVILTAAHCALAKANNFKLFSVLVGEWDTRHQIDCGDEFCGLPSQEMGISHIIVHPGYEKQTFKNNIALIVLRNRVNYTITAQPICLPEPFSVTNSNGIVIGWGKTPGQRAEPFIQQVVHVPIITIEECYQIYGKTMPISDDQICAGGNNGKDVCTGFGGAPLLVRHGDTHYQVGIVSYGSEQCLTRGGPSVYTNIKKYVEWIRENIPANPY